MPDAAPEDKHAKPTLSDLHWRATLRTRSRDDLDNDMADAIEKNNSWRFSMLMQLNAGWGHNERMLRAAVVNGREQMFDAMVKKDKGWEDHVRVDSLAGDAAENGQLGFLKRFVEKHKADIHYYSEEMLRKSVEKGQTAIVAYLLEKGADPKTWNNEPLRTAVSNGNLDITKLLVDHGAELNANHYGTDILGLGVSSGNTALVSYLLDKGADVKHDHYNAFVTAAREGDIAMLNLFLDRNVDANAEDAEALITAVQNGKFAAADLLVDRGADIDGQNGKALRNAAYQKDIPAAKYLLNRGADVNAHAARETPLVEAVAGGSEEMVMLLMRHGADYTAQQGAAWERARRERGMLRAIVKGVRAANAATREAKQIEFDSLFDGKSYTLDDLRRIKGPSGDTGLLIAAQTGKFGEIVSAAKSGLLTGADLYHPDDRIDTVFSMLHRQRALQDFFHPAVWASRPVEVKEAIEMLPARYQKRIRLGPITNEMNYRELRRKAANSNMSLKPKKDGPAP